jgi:glycosyltransferase involved in cell wall biosynthesis
MKILLLYDVKGWAWYLKANAIKLNLPEYDIHVKCQNEFTPKDLTTYDTIHFFDWECGIGFAKHVNVTTSVTSHNHELLNWDYAKVNIPKFSAISCISKEIHDRLKSQGLNKVLYTCQNGVNDKLFFPKSKPDNSKFTVGWVSQRTSGGFQKGGKIDIKGYQHVLLPLKEKLKQYTDIDLIEHSETWKTATPHSDMPKLYHKFDVLISTSFLEGTPGSIFEGAATGLPVISTAVGCVPELVTNMHNGILIPTYKDAAEATARIDDFIKWILYLRDNRDICRKMGEANRIEVEKNWSWAIKSKCWIPVFENHKKAVK